MAADLILRSGGVAASPAVILTSGASGRLRAILSLRALRSLLALLYSVVLLLLIPFRSSRKEKKPVRVPWRRAAAAAVAADQAVAARRATAIRRVVLDQKSDSLSVRDFEVFVNTRGDNIFTQSWSPITPKLRNNCEQSSFVDSLCNSISMDLAPRISVPKGVIVLLHGLNEHSGRYDCFAKELNANGYKVYGMDWIGHGGSDGLHAYVPSLDYAVADTKLFLEKVLAENPELPCFCFGHSTGGAIILKAMLDSKIEGRVAGVVLTSPAVGVQPSHPIFSVLAPIISFLMPRYQVSAANKKGSVVSRDPEALIAKYSDPLVFTGSIRVRTGYEILKITSHLQRSLRRLRVPFLVLHGSADTVTDPKASKKLYEEASSLDKTIKLYDGLLHDLLFEPEREDVARDIIDWLNDRTSD